MLRVLTIRAPSISFLINITSAMSLEGLGKGPGPFFHLLNSTTSMRFSFYPGGEFVATGMLDEMEDMKYSKWISEGDIDMMEMNHRKFWSITCSTIFSTHNSAHIMGADPIPTAFVHQAEFMGVHYERIGSVKIMGPGDLGDKFYRILFERCSDLKCFIFDPVPPPSEMGRPESPHPSYQPASPATALRILSEIIGVDLCTGLEEVHLTGDFSAWAQDLAEWLQSRREAKFELKKTVVDSSCSFELLRRGWGKLLKPVRAAREDALEYEDSSNKRRAEMIWVYPMVVKAGGPDVQDSDAVQGEGIKRVYQT
ncbi:hypothetical protein FRC17_002305 [Serendipita sp. 399]|nr:hypothetical protein FRC17_002305 [Serendipita sp. 399]